MVVNRAGREEPERVSSALAKSKPGELNYGTTGVGAANHLVTELFDSRAGITMTHIPYRGTALCGDRSARRPGANGVRRSDLGAATRERRTLLALAVTSRTARRWRPRCRRLTTAGGCAGSGWPALASKPGDTPPSRQPSAPRRHGERSFLVTARASNVPAFTCAAPRSDRRTPFAPGRRADPVTASAVRDRNMGHCNPGPAVEQFGDQVIGGGRRPVVP